MLHTANHENAELLRTLGKNRGLLWLMPKTSQWMPLLHQFFRPVGNG